MDHRSYGETRNCKGCRFWSEMVAQDMGGSTEALCLGAGPRAGKFVPGWFSCDAWKSGHLGAIDEPGTDGSQYDADPDPAAHRAVELSERAA